MADASPRTDTSTDADTEDKNVRVTYKLIQYAEILSTLYWACIV